MEGGEFMLLDTIKTLCEQKGITITELERILQFGNGTLHKWSRGRASTDKVAKVADYFDVSIDCILGRESKLPTSEARELAKTYDLLTNEQKGLVKCYMSIVKNGALQVGR
jgi:transcriptional regulator with XRE-family HTH domain